VATGGRYVASGKPHKLGIFAEGGVCCKELRLKNLFEAAVVER